MLAEEVDLEDGVVGEHPVIRLADERSEDGGGDLAVVERAERLTHVVEQGAHHVLVVAPVAQGAGGGLQAVGLPVDGVLLVPSELGQQAEQEVGKTVRGLPVHVGQDGEVGVGALVHSPKLHA